MDEMLKELERFRDLSGTFTPLDVILVLFLSFALSLMVAWVYRLTHRGVSYSQTYVHTLVIMGTVVSLIMLIIGSNIARAFALVGALSIIRFRNAMKETRDVGFIFLAMAIGMAVGTRFYLLAIFATVVLSAFIVILAKLDLFARRIQERILRVQLPVDRDPQAAFADAFAKHLQEQRLVSLETIRAGVLQEATYTVVLKAAAGPQSLLEDLRRANDNHKVMLLLGQQEIDV